MCRCGTYFQSAPIEPDYGPELRRRNGDVSDDEYLRYILTMRAETSEHPAAARCPCSHVV
jgi:hypothetical protein